MFRPMSVPRAEELVSLFTSTKAASLRAVKIKMVRGRAFDARDAAQSQPVLIVNRTGSSANPFRA